MERIDVRIYRRGGLWVAEASTLNMTFMADTPEEAGAAVRAALRTCGQGLAEIDVFEGQYQRVRGAGEGGSQGFLRE